MALLGGGWGWGFIQELFCRALPATELGGWHFQQDQSLRVKVHKGFWNTLLSSHILRLAGPSKSEIWLISYLGKIKVSHTFSYFYKGIKQFPAFTGMHFSTLFQAKLWGSFLFSAYKRWQRRIRMCSVYGSMPGVIRESPRKISLGNGIMRTPAAGISCRRGTAESDTLTLIGLLTWEPQSNQSSSGCDVAQGTLPLLAGSLQTSLNMKRHSHIWLKISSQKEVCWPFGFDMQAAGRKSRMIFHSVQRD